MGKTPCCDRQGLKKGAWTEEEDHKLLSYVRQHGEGGWRSLPQKAGLLRCGKSCRLRWANYLRPGIKRGEFTPEEEQTIIQLHAILGNRWSTIARHLYKRTDNEIKNYWNTRLKRRVAEMSSTSSSSTSTTRTTMDPHHLMPDHDQTSMIINFPTTDHDQERERSTSAEDVHHKKSPGPTSSSSNSTHNVNKVAKPTSTHSLTTFATTLTQTTSSHYGPTTSTNTTSSTTISEFDQVSKSSSSSSSSSARILNKIASKLTLLNLPRVVVNGGGGLTCDSRVDGSARGSSSVREFSPCGGYNSGSPGSASTPISSVDPNFEDFSPPAPILSRQSGFSTYSGDQSICKKEMELDLLEELLSETDAYNIAEDFKKDDDDVDVDLEQMLVTSFPLISSDYDQ